MVVGLGRITHTVRGSSESLAVQLAVLVMGVEGNIVYTGGTESLEVG